MRTALEKLELCLKKVQWHRQEILTQKETDPLGIKVSASLRFEVIVLHVYLLRTIFCRGIGIEVFFRVFLGGFVGFLKNFFYTRTWDLSLSLLYPETYLSVSVWYFQFNFSPKHKGLRLPIKLKTGPTAFSILLVFCVMLKGTSGCLKLTAWFCDWSVWWHKLFLYIFYYFLISTLQILDWMFLSYLKLSMCKLKCTEILF